MAPGKSVDEIVAAALAYAEKKNDKTPPKGHNESSATNPSNMQSLHSFFSEGSAASSQKNPIFPNRKSISTKSASSNSRSQIDVNDLVAEVMGAVAASSQSQSQHTMGSSRRMERMESLNSQSERSADSFYSDGSTDASSSEIESPGGVANYQC